MDFVNSVVIQNGDVGVPKTLMFSSGERLKPHGEKPFFVGLMVIPSGCCSWIMWAWELRNSSAEIHELKQATVEIRNEWARAETVCRKNTRSVH